MPVVATGLARNPGPIAPRHWSGRQPVLPTPQHRSR